MTAFLLAVFLLLLAGLTAYGIVALVVATVSGNYRPLLIVGAVGAFVVAAFVLSLFIPKDWI